MESKAKAWYFKFSAIFMDRLAWRNLAVKIRLTKPAKTTKNCEVTFAPTWKVKAEIEADVNMSKNVFLFSLQPLVSVARTIIAEQEM